MPRGKASTERKALSYRVRKNAEWGLEHRRRLYETMLDVDLSEANSLEELERMRNEIIDAAIQQRESAVSVIVAEAYQVDPPLMVAVEQEIFDTCTEQTEEMIPFIIDSFAQASESCYYPEQEECCWCEKQPAPSYGYQIQIGGAFSPLTHSQHPKGDITISGSKIRGCVTDQCEAISCVCNTEDSFCHRTFITRTDEQLLRDYSKIDPRCYQRYRNRTSQDSFCRCVDLCAYSIDFKRDVDELRAIFKNYDLRLSRSLREELPGEIVSLVEDHLTCREKFILSIFDGEPRRGCRLRRNYINKRDKILPPKERCICSTMLYRAPYLVKTLSVLRCSGFRGPPWHNSSL